MTGIILTEKKLERRRLALQQVFRAVARSSRVEVFYQYGATSIIIGLGKENFGSDLRRARHPSRISNIFVNYFEVWLAQKGGVQFLLDKAYMHLDIPFADGTGDEEVLALHCDPTIAETDPSYTYKRGPHLHISGNKRDISRAHIALCLSDIERSCHNYDAFSKVFAEIILMIDHELLPKFQ